MSASKLHKASENATFFALNLIFIVQLYSVQIPVGKRELFGPKKSSQEISVVCVALVAILPFLMTSPHTQFWLWPELCTVFRLYNNSLNIVILCVSYFTCSL